MKAKKVSKKLPLREQLRLKELKAALRYTPKQRLIEAMELSEFCLKLRNALRKQKKK
jgi:hypothetical protein